VSKNTVIAFPEQDDHLEAQRICPALIASTFPHSAECPRLAPKVSVVIKSDGKLDIFDVDSVHGLVKALLSAASASGDVRIYVVRPGAQRLYDIVSEYKK